MRSIAQHIDPAGFYFEMIVPGASAAELERGVKAAWDYFLVTQIRPQDAVQVEFQVERWKAGDPPIENAHLEGAWNNAQYRAIDACCLGWPDTPIRWKLILHAPSE